MEYNWDFPSSSVGKNLPAMQENGVRSLGQEDPLEKGMAISSTLAWRIPWTEDPVGYSSWDHKESDTSVQLTFLSFSVPTKCQVLEEMIVKATDLTNFQFDWEK